MKELDELITYIENDLIGEHKDIEIIDEAIKKYAELYHKKQLELYGVVKQSELVCRSYYPNNMSTGMECLNCGKGKHEH